MTVNTITIIMNVIKSSVGRSATVIYVIVKSHYEEVIVVIT